MVPLHPRLERNRPQLMYRLISTLTRDLNGLTSYTRGLGLLAILTAGLTATTALHAADSVDAANIGVQVPEGFEVTLYADDELAHDIYSMTVDARGRVVVSGAGYVRILIDADGDGRAESFQQFADGPKTGAQGMYFFGRDLLCSGDAGLIRYRDADGDDRADGPPETFVKMKAGGEHDCHAIRKGADGWWYMIVGNYGGVDQRYNTTLTPPIKDPEAGVIYRLTPDLSQGEVVVHGFRNAYDFDFGVTGDLLTFDSDGERDISLPWYRPTRVFHALPGTHAGFLSRSWKRADESLDMPPVVAEFGRGSPSGVVCYRHHQFPESLHGALFVLDWTYGRVMALPLEPQGSTWSTQPIEFMKAIGQHGFAPTDIAVGPDGALYVSVGGRGTRGGVYRIVARGLHDESPWFEREVPSLPAQKLEHVLTAPQPLDSWSRDVWGPLADELGSGPFIAAAADESREVSQRVRAIEILTERFRGLGMELAETLLRSPSATVRARVAWSLGRVNPTSPSASLMGALLDDAEPTVVRVALEALLAADVATLQELVQPIGKALGSPDKAVRLLAIKVLLRTDADTYHEVAAAAVVHGWEAAIGIAFAYAERHPGVDPYSIDIAFRILEADHPITVRRNAVRLLQVALGDVGPQSLDGTTADGTTRKRAPGSKGTGTADPDADASTSDDLDVEKRAPVFDGYASRLDLTPFETDLVTVRTRLAALYPDGDQEIDRELSRVIAMVQPTDSLFVEKLLKPITGQSHPVDDLHQLICLARIPAARNESQRFRIAEALLRVEPKLKSRQLVQDSNWGDRVLEMYRALGTIDPELPLALLRNPACGEAAHVQYLSLLSPDYYGEALATFTKKLREQGDEYAWNSDVVFLFAESEDPEILNLLRSKFSDFGLRGAVVLALSGRLDEADRELFVTSLEASQPEVLAESVRTLALLDPGKSARENVMLVRTLRRLSDKGPERAIRDQVIEVLRRNNNGTEFAYQLGLDGNPQKRSIDAWTAYIREKFPEEFALQAGEDADVVASLFKSLSTVDWTQGDASRGEKLFTTRACVQCHGGRSALGPDLSGVTGRFSKADLFTAIVLPNRDVSPRYQTTTIITNEGKSYTGLIVYESVDGLVLRDATNRTYRIESNQIEFRRTVPTSLMPTGLLKDLKPTDLADLYSYLHSLTLRTAER
ncbi:MAG: c-type cytochrome [Planctomycetaceae bacterium]